MAGFTNSRRFQRKLAELPKAVAEAARSAIEEGAAEMVAAMKNLVPVRHGDLRDSIGWCWGLPPKGAHALFFVSARSLTILGGGTRPTGDFITIFAGDEKAFYARWVEFGTHARAPGAYRDERNRKRNAGKRGHPATPPEPFFYPVWRSYKKSVKAHIARKVNAAIKKIAASQAGS
jgi:HK97 gp10 family phage protein